MTASIFGSVVRRSEDPRFLRGEGRYVENIAIDGALHAWFVRSIMAHARVIGVDLSKALAVRGVAGAFVAAFVAADLGLPAIPPSGSSALGLANQLAHLQQHLGQHGAVSHAGGNENGAEGSNVHGHSGEHGHVGQPHDRNEGDPTKGQSTDPHGKPADPGGGNGGNGGNGGDATSP